MQTTTAAAYHQQVQALAPTATAETSGTSGLLLATLTTPTGDRIEAAGFTAGDVVAELRAKIVALVATASATRLAAEAQQDAAFARLAATARPDFMAHYSDARFLAGRTV